MLALGYVVPEPQGWGFRCWKVVLQHLRFPASLPC